MSSFGRKATDKRGTVRSVQADVPMIGYMQAERLDNVMCGYSAVCA